MEFDPEAVERLSPTARVEVQDWIARRWLELHTPRQPSERRRVMRLRQRRRGWPKRWHRQDDPSTVALRQTRWKGVA